MFAVAAVLKKENLFPGNSHELVSCLRPVFHLQICKLFNYVNVCLIFLIECRTMQQPLFDFAITSPQGWLSTPPCQPAYEGRKDFGLKHVPLWNQDRFTSRKRCSLFAWLFVGQTKAGRPASVGGLQTETRGSPASVLPTLF